MTTCAKCSVGQEHQFKHGTLTGYSYHKCRCDECLPVWNAYQGGYRERNRAQLNERQLQRRSADRPRARKMEREGARRRRQDPAVRQRCREADWRHYHIGGGKGREQERRKRNAAYNNRQRLKYQSGIPTPRAGELWTAADDAITIREDITVFEMAYMLGRSYDAVANRRNAHNRQAWNAERRGIPAPRRREPWTSADDVTVIRDDISLTAICHLLGRSYDAAHSRRALLRKGGPKGRYEETRACDECGTNFVALAPWARFCSSKCKSLNHQALTPVSVGRVRWTPADDVTAMRDDISVTEICHLLGRSYNAACRRRALLRNGGPKGRYEEKRTGRDRPAADRRA